MNNATYYELFDTAVNAHLFEATGLDVRALPADRGGRGDVVPLLPRDRLPGARSTWGWSWSKVGTSSVIYRIGLFQGDGDEAAAEGRFVHVYVDNTDAGDGPSSRCRTRSGPRSRPCCATDVCRPG